MTALDTLPSDNPVQNRNSAFLAALNAYNRETLLLTQASEIITRTGQDLDRLLESGTENLSPDDQRRYLETLREFESFIVQFKARIGEQVKRESSLRRQAKALGACVDFHQLSDLENN